ACDHPGRDLDHAAAVIVHRRLGRTFEDREVEHERISRVPDGGEVGVGTRLHFGGDVDVVLAPLGLVGHGSTVPQRTDTLGGRPRCPGRPGGSARTAPTPVATGRRRSEWCYRLCRLGPTRGTRSGVMTVEEASA